jgi:hypothetical protein
MRKLRFLFQEPGLIEAVVSDPDIPRSKTGIDTPGYRSLWVTDLMVDFDPRSNKPYAFMISSFEKTYPLVIWALKFYMADELFDVPQAGLTAVPLHEAFSWAYAHFVLEDQKPIFQPERPPEPRSLTHQVLRYAAATA